MNAPATLAEHDLAPLREFIADPATSEIAINPDGGAWIERHGAAHMQPLDLSLPPQRQAAMARNLAGVTNNALGERHPLVSGRLTAFGRPLRLQIAAPPAVEGAPALSFRAFGEARLELSAFEFLDGASRDADAARGERLTALRDLAEAGELQTLLQRAVAERLNIVISGGTSSGKTSFARALLALADPAERLLTIEDAPELLLPHPNAIPLIAERRRDSPRSPALLLESALRMRPDRIILGELRGPEGFDFLEAINTGHPGSLTTIHADTPGLAMERLAGMALRAGTPLTRAELLDYARRTVDLVVQLGRKDGRRGVVGVKVMG